MGAVITLENLIDTRDSIFLVSYLTSESGSYQVERISGKTKYLVVSDIF